MLDPGRYEVTLKYESEGDTGYWDIRAAVGMLQKASIPDTHGEVDELVVEIDLPRGADDFQVVTVYSGHGRLSVLSVGIRP
jgi:hypothetical protein